MRGFMCSPRLKARIGHIYPMRRGAPRGGEGEAEGKVAEEREGGS